MKMTPSKTLVLLLPVLVLVAGPMLFGRWRASHAALQDDEFNDEWCKSTYLGKNLTEQYRSGEYKRRSIDCVVHGESVG
jgi:hypothetical protein